MTSFSKQPILKHACLGVALSAAFQASPVLADGSPAARQPERVIALEMGGRQINWDTDHGESGRQDGSHLAVSYETPRYSLGVRGMYLATDRRYDVDDDLWGGRYAGMTDASIAAVLRSQSGSPDDLGWAVRLEVSMPTGKSNLAGRDRNVLVNHLFLDRVQWGEGQNVQLDGTLSSEIIPGLSTSATLALTSRSAYHHDGNSPESKLDPGDRVAGSANLTWRDGPWMASMTGRHTREGRASLDGLDVHQRGDSTDLLLFGLHSAGMLNLSGTLAYFSRSNDRFPDAQAGGLVRERDRSASPLFMATIGAERAISDTLSFGASLRHMKAGENEYDITSMRFMPERRLDAAEISATWRPTSSSSLRFAAAVFRQVDTDPAGFEDARYRGHSVGLTYRVVSAK